MTAFSTVQESRTQAPETESELKRSPEGWTDLLAKGGTGPRFTGLPTGWDRRDLAYDRPKFDTPDPGQWSFAFLEKGGSISCSVDGKHEWLRWEDELDDFIFHAEWRFLPIQGKKKEYNSGIYVRTSADASVWLQAEIGDASGGYLLGDTPVKGKVKRVNLSQQLRDKRVKPVATPDRPQTDGGWNTYEITCKGKEISLWVNGAVTSVFDDCEVPRGYIGLEADGRKIQFRNLKLKKLGGDRRK
jgi:hypothetical protein